MGSLERVISRINSPSPSQTAQYPAPQAVQGIAQSNLDSLAQPAQYPAALAPQISSTSAYPTQVSSPTSTAPELSAETAAVVNHFGLEAPGILNQYATTLEDAMIEQQSVLEATQNRAAAMELILTDGDQLADYTNRFFSEVEPIDTMTEEGYFDDDGDFWSNEELEQARQQLEVEDMQQMGVNPYQQQYDQVPAIPAANAGSERMIDPQLQWEGFKNVMDQSPDQAYRYLSNMSNDAMRSKLLFMDQG